MAKEESITVRGKITEVLPGSMFRVELETGNKILAHLSGKMRIHYIKLVKGDSVLIELSAYDLTKGRIVSRLRHDAA